MSTQHTPAVNPRTLADTTYTLVINERQRHLIHLALSKLIASREDYTDDQVVEGDDKELEMLEAMMDPNDEDPLLPSPAVNGLTL